MFHLYTFVYKIIKKKTLSRYTNQLQLIRYVQILIHNRSFELVYLSNDLSHPVFFVIL